VKKESYEEKIIIQNRKLENVIEEVISKKVGVSIEKLKEYMKNYDPQNIQAYSLTEQNFYNIMYLVAVIIVKEGAISYWSALYHHNLSDRLSRVIYVQTTKKRGYTHLENFNGENVIKLYNFYVKPVVIKEDKYFGLLSYLDKDTGIEYAITDREKTVLDCIDKPKYCGGLPEIVAGISYSKLDYQRIVEYADRLQNYTVIKRLGYISEKLGWGIEKELKRLLSQRALRTYSILDPTQGSSGIKDKVWKLIVNVPDDIWEVELG